MFEKELDKFRNSQPDLKSRNPDGGFVVIFGYEILGVWRDRQDALNEGIKKYGNTPFLLKNINEDIDSVSGLINFSRHPYFL